MSVHYNKSVYILNTILNTILHRICPHIIKWGEGAMTMCEIVCCEKWSPPAVGSTVLHGSDGQRKMCGSFSSGEGLPFLDIASCNEDGPGCRRESATYKGGRGRVNPLPRKTIHITLLVASFYWKIPRSSEFGETTHLPTQ